jgi:hypothetical protein
LIIIEFLIDERKRGTFEAEETSNI